MTKPFLVGITGGIGSGKSIVSQFFQLLGIEVYNSDDRGKRLMVEDKELVSQVKEAFGDKSYFDDGSLNRSYLAAEVFPDEDKLRVLNGLVHPVVGRDFRNWVSHHQNNPYLIKEAALMFETGIYEQMDKNICVMASKDTRMERVLLRDTQRDRQQVEDIMSRQVSDNMRKKLADYLINNEGNELLIPQVLEIHKYLLSLLTKRS